MEECRNKPEQQQTMIENILFDMGNVLTAYDARWITEPFPAPSDMEKEVLASVFYSQEWVQLDMGLITEEEGLEAMKERLDTPEKRKLAEQYFYNWHIYNLAPMPGMEALIHDLKNAGKKVFVLSNASVRMLSAYREKIPAWDCFDGMLFSAEVGYIKPQKEIYQIAMERFHILPQESFFIDDLPRNVEAGKKLGMDGYVFENDVEKLRQKLASLLNLAL